MTQRFGKRLFASMLLASMTAATAAPLPAHSLLADADCHHTVSAGTALSESAAPAGCDHDAGTACAAMLGCVVLPSMLNSAVTRFDALGAVALVTPFANGALHGRLSIGPPTPPPNS